MRQRCGGHVPGSPGTTHPRGDVGPILLGLLADAVVLGALRVDLGGHAVEALGKRAKHMSEMARAMRPLPSSKGWMVTNQRWARAARTTWLVSGGALEPFQEGGHFPWNQRRVRTLEVDSLAANGAREDLDRIRAVFPCGYGPGAAAAGREC